MIDLAGLPLVTLVVFVPLVGALAIAFLPASRPDLVRYTALAFALVAWVVSLAMLAAFVAGNHEFQLVDQADWIPTFGIQYKVGVDGLSLVLVLLTTTLTWVSILASFGPIQVRVKEYMISFLVLEVGMAGVFVARDLFLFYIFWETVLIPMYLIIGIWGGKNRIYATIKFVIYTLVGSLLMLVAILATAYTYQAAHGGWEGAFDVQKLTDFAATGAFGGTFGLLAFGAFFMAFAIKVPMFPLHTWLPDAHTEAPTAGSIILAGLLLKMGAYGFIRYSLPLFPEAAHTWAPLLIVLSVIAILYGAIQALVQPDLKRLIAYSSVSHMGFVTLGTFVFQEQALYGAILQMVNHGLITGGLFLLVGLIYERTHDRTIAKMGGLGAAVPIWAAAFGFFVFASVGLPGLSGFVGEFLTLVGTFYVSPITAGAATLVMILAAAYLLWMYQRIAFGELTDFMRGLGHHLTDLKPIEMLSVVPLATMIVVLGLYPGLVLDLVAGSVDTVMAAVNRVGPVALSLWR